jgi:hypothetical protein
VQLRSPEEIAAAAELAYLLQWATYDCELRGVPRPGALEPWIIMERRRALDWVLDTDTWDLITLDT